MRFESRTWFLLSLLFLAGSVYFWLWGNEYENRRNKNRHQPSQGSSQTNQPTALTPTGQKPYQLLSQVNQQPLAPRPTAPVSAFAPNPTPAVKPSAFPHRLSNTAKTVAQLNHAEAAILMRNAFIDTSEGTSLPIPDALRSEGNPGSYIVQARGPIQAAFRDRLREAGATIVSYIPNNAYLVELSTEGAARLARAPETQAVLPYEPYYKLDPKLLATAVEEKPLDATDRLRLTAFPSQRDAAVAAVKTLGAEILNEERTPFGPQLLVKPTPDSLVALAKVPAVQTLELFRSRKPLLDQVRVTVGVSGSGSSLTNYLNLTGTNVMVNVSDTGVDANHPDLRGRVLGDTPIILTDFPAHGTHVAGILAGNGSASSSVSGAPIGSSTNANFRGIAPAAQILALPFQGFPDVNPWLNDAYLQETAALTNATMSRRRTGPMVSNNSWGYVGVTEYDSSSATYDAAVRDAVPGLAGSQPMIFVFAAGNSGEGTDDGLGGNPNSIPSPANAKNVIAVGALEQFRYVTNSAAVTNEDGTVSTNIPFLGLTDTLDQIASFSSRGNVGIGTEGEFGRFKPDVVAPGTFIVSTRARDWALENEVDTNSPEYQILKDLNDPLAPSYRFETGTSQAAPVVSGVLALMQEFFEQRLPANLRRTNSPAMMKALLINGAHSAGPHYDLEVNNSVNYQGWGLISLTNTLAPLMTTGPETRWPLRMFEQNPTNALGTGQSRSWNVVVSTNAQIAPFRVTLVWTDPPGNPNAAIKLVNDLDLVVSNTVSGEVYYGNDIRHGNDFNHPSFPEEGPTRDIINNVENVFLREATSSNFVVSVIGRRINVSALPEFNLATGQTNDIVQDFALVISSGDKTVTNAFTITPITPEPLPQVTAVPMTNGVPLLNQRVGANAPFFNSRHGITNQWNFYVFTNVYVTNDVSTLTNGTNVAFVTFLPPNAGRPRLEEADIDLYVSKDPELVALVPATVDAAWKSTSRGGTESIVFTNAALGDIFYIGVKSEDQQSGEFGLIALSTDQPFDENRDGARILHGLPVPQPIPDGSPSQPGSATIIAIGINPITIQRIVVTNVITHEDVGDLSIILDHNESSVVLHNHTLNNGIFSGTNLFFIYDDQSFGPISGTRHTDGPGSLTDFVGSEGSGVWMMNVVDNSPNYVGRVESCTIRLEPFENQDLNAAGSAGLDGTVGPNDATCYFFDVPPEATNLTVRISQLTGPVEALLQYGGVPTTNQFVKSATISPPGGDLSLGANDEPVPLQAGRYVVCLYNPGASIVNFHIATILKLGVGLDFQRTLISTNGLSIPDDGTIISSVNVPVDKQVATVDVAVRIEHPRSSDLVLHLVSPQGTRLLLAENRGGSDSRGYGAGFGTNITYTIFTENSNLLESLAPIKFALPPWTNVNGATNPLAFFDSFESATPGIYGSNQTFSGWTVAQGIAQVHTLGDSFGAAPQTGTNFVELDTTSSPASILTSFPTTAGKDYLLTFYFQRNPAAPAGNSHALSLYYGAPADFRPAVKFIPALLAGWQSTNIVFKATSPETQLELGSVTSTGPLVDTILVSELIAATNVYVLPEESLRQLQGERAYGDWKLEVWDNRRGPQGGGTGVLLGWDLQIKYGNPAGKALALTNGLSFSGVISTNQTNYFVVDVCETSTVAFANLSGPFAKLNLLVDRGGIPTGDPSRDDFVPLLNVLPLDGNLETGFATIKLDTNPNQPAPLLPGRQLFFGIYNANPEETNSFNFQVTFNNDTCTEGSSIIRLESDVAYTNVVAPSASLFDYYVFNVTPTAIEATFEATPRNGDIGMVLRYGLPLPDLTKFDFRSDRPGITNELIVLTNNSTPVKLTSGDWYIGVYNNQTNAVVYDIRASEILDTNLNVVVLTNGVPLDYTILQGSGLTNFFLLSVLKPAAGVQFELYGLNANVDLLIARNSVPAYTNFFLSNSASPSKPLTIEIRTNVTVQDVQGNWMLAVINKDPTNLQFTIKGTIIETNEVSTTNRVFDPDITISATNICFSWSTTAGLTYQLEGKKSISDAKWTILFGPFVATNNAANYCLSLPSEYAFFRVVELNGSTEPPEPVIVTPTIIVTTNSICLAWDSTVGFFYQVQAKASFTDLTWVDLTPPTAATTTNSLYCIPLPSPYRLFQIVETQSGGTNQPPPTGTILNPALDVSTNGVCLTWPSKPGIKYELDGKIQITDPVWTNLTGTITATNTSMTFCLPLTTPYQFFQVIEGSGGTTNQPPPVTGGTVAADVDVSTNGVCLSWISKVGTDYQIDGKIQITDLAWTNLSGTITATNSTTTYCLPVTTPYHYFLVIEGAGGTNQPPPVTGTNVAANLDVSTNGVCLSWQSKIGVDYELDAKIAITDTIWTNLSGTITATNTTTTYCLPVTTPYHYFLVIESAGGATNQPPPITGTNVTADVDVSTNGVCLSWTSVVGTVYELDGKVSVTDTVWTNLSGAITATNTITTFCLPNTTPYHFFQVLAAAGGTTNQPPPITGTNVTADVDVGTKGVCLSWSSVVGAQYELDGKVSVTDTVWTNLSGTITATNTVTTYCLPNTTPYHFFQVLAAAGGATNQPPPVSTNSLNPKFSFTTTNVCLAWPSVQGGQYSLHGKMGITDTVWTNLSGTITATETNTTFCLPSTTPYRFFVVLGNAGTGTGGGTTNQVTLHAPEFLADGRLQLVWEGEAGVSYDLQVTTNLVPVISWTTLTNFSAGANSAIVTPGSPATNGVMRFYRIIRH